MPVPLLYIYINRPGERGGGRRLPPFLGKGDLLKNLCKWFYSPTQLSSVELANNGGRWQAYLVFLIKFSFLSIRGTNVRCTNANVRYKCGTYKRNIMSHQLIPTIILQLGTVKNVWQYNGNNLYSHFNSLPWRIILSRGNLIENGNIVLYYLICNASKIAQKTQNTKKKSFQKEFLEVLSFKIINFQFSKSTLF